ncbi:MAG: hypothetical protein ACWA44_09270 [Thiotrichales bacterium]
MMKPLLLGCAALISGCMTSRYQPPPVQAVIENPHEITISKSYDEAWQDLLNYFAKPDFVMGEVAQDLGLISVSFKSKEISEYVDCGQYQERDGHSAFSGTYATYLETYNRPTVLGEMNIQLDSVNEHQTHLSVSTDYRVMCSNDVWEFNSREASTIVSPRAAPGTIPTRTCRATHKPEDKLLQYLASL